MAAWPLADISGFNLIIFDSVSFLAPRSPWPRYAAGLTGTAGQDGPASSHRTGESCDRTVLRYAYETAFDNAEMFREVLFAPQ